MQPKEEDHPRRCGEHRVGCCCHQIAWGSSPQMRGARPIAILVFAGAGIIPADAGSTQQHPHKGRAHQDHPRRCGEHDDRFLSVSQLGGSSPQMRGAHCSLLPTSCGLRIIPADAGSTNWRPYGDPGEKDHPRRCGEHDEKEPEPEDNGGSSPQMRGALVVPRQVVLVGRIIPADAGSTR